MPKLCPVCGATFTDANVFCPKDGSTLRAADLDSDLIGTVVADRYLVTDLLGEGGMGKVYLARHVRLPQQAAIKVLRPAMLRDPAAVARFNREAANASSIEHEHIARVFDFGESADGTVYLAMEYVPGRTLKKLLSSDGPQSPERTARITRQIGDALDAAHKLGIVHRDLKPDNVMVVESADSGDRCKVVDFGIAKAVGGDAGEAGLTKTGFVVGTPEFMSPEQILGSAIDHRSDVYALALLTFQCLTGKLPFDSSTPERAMTARLIEAPMQLATVKDDVRWPESVQAVMDRGLARDPEQRYGSAGQFAREFQQAVAAWGGDTTVGAGFGEPVDVSARNALSDRIGAPANDPSHPRRSPGAGTLNDSFTTRSYLVGPNVPTRTAIGTRPEAEETSSALAASAGSQSPTSRVPMIAGAAVGILAVAAAIWAMTQPGRSPTTSQSPAPPESSVVLGEVTSATTNTGGGRGVSAVAPQAGTEPATVQRPTIEIQRDSITIASLQRQSRDNRQQVVRSSPQSDRGETGAVRPRETPAAAKFTLDSLRVTLNPATASEADARRAVAALRDLMPRLATAEDSAWGYLRQAEAHFLMVDELSACVALKAARPLIRDAAQQRVLRDFSAVITVRC